MKKILFISTGGTFNKHYNPETGLIDIDQQASTLQEIAHKWRTKLNIITIIGKDSLDIDEDDRVLLLDAIRESEFRDIIIIHGTDTMDQSAKKIYAANIDKRIVFAGAMTPYRVDKVEATANIAMAYGFLQADIDNGVYISMNGVIGEFDKVIKNRETKRFESL
ncbi:MAG: asparaginase [Sulfurovum sp.]|nr:asparaginase [Sulfurovum sp.]